MVLDHRFPIGSEDSHSLSEGINGTYGESMVSNHAVPDAEMKGAAGKGAAREHARSLAPFPQGSTEKEPVTSKGAREHSTVHETPIEASHDGTDRQLRIVESPVATCREWFDDHVHRLLAEGVSTAHSAAVYAEGEAAGWKIDNLRKVASKSPLVAVAERRPDGYLWNIGENAQATVTTADQWLTGFLTGRGWVKASEVYAAAVAAGWTRDAIKSAALADHIAKRGASIATEWNLIREQESA